jgi:hypothetical protein
MIEYMSQKESEEDKEIPEEIFSEEQIKNQKTMIIALIAKAWGPGFNRRTPDFKALTKFLNA